MCIGSMCNGSSLPTVYRFTDQSAAQSLVVHLDATGTATYPVVINHSTIGTVVGGKLHNCPSCLCVQVNP